MSKLSCLFTGALCMVFSILSGGLSLCATDLLILVRAESLSIQWLVLSCFWGIVYVIKDELCESKK